AGGGDALDVEDLEQTLGDLLDEGLRLREEHPALPRLQLGDAVEDVGLGSLGQAADRADAVLLGGTPELVERLDAQLRVDQAHRLRPKTRKPYHLYHACGELGEQLLAILAPARLGELRELVRDRLADPRDLRRRAFAIRPGDLDRVPSDRVRR